MSIQDRTTCNVCKKVGKGRRCCLVCKRAYCEYCFDMHMTILSIINAMALSPMDRRFQKIVLSLQALYSIGVTGNHVTSGMENSHGQ